MNDEVRFYKHSELMQRRAEYKTNHILHLLLTLVTGFWLLVWVFVSIRNANKRGEIDRKLNMMQW